MKPVIPACKQALKDKKNEKSAEISNSTTGLTGMSLLRLPQILV